MAHERKMFRFMDQFSEEVSRLARVLGESRSRAHEAAARFYGHAAFAAQRTILGFVLGDGKVQQSLSLDSQFKRAATSVD
jgi:hypothetical protein